MSPILKFIYKKNIQTAFLVSLRTVNFVIASKRSLRGNLKTVVKIIIIFSYPLFALVVILGLPQELASQWEKGANEQEYQIYACELIIARFVT